MALHVPEWIELKETHNIAMSVAKSLSSLITVMYIQSNQLITKTLAHAAKVISTTEIHALWILQALYTSIAVLLHGHCV